MAETALLLILPPKPTAIVMEALDGEVCLSIPPLNSSHARIVTALCPRVVAVATVVALSLQALVALEMAQVLAVAVQRISLVLPALSF
jgi:hypothetical protein